MEASPAGEIVILIISLIVLVFFLFREAFSQTKTSWRVGLSDFLTRPVNPNTKSITVIAFGILFIGLIFWLIIQRIILLL